MAIDRISAADTDGETIEDRATPERPPPPDTPGQMGVPSRADSRVAAAAANSDAGEQPDDEPRDEKPRAGVSAEDSTGEQPSEAAEDRSAKPVTTDDSGPGDGETPIEAQSPSSPESGSDAAETAREEAGEADVSETGGSGDGAEESARTDTASRNDWSAETIAPAEDDGIAEADMPDLADAAEDEADRAGEVEPRLNEPEAAGADDIGPGRKEPILAEDAPTVAQSPRDTKDLPKPPGAGESVSVDRDVASRRLEPLTDREYAEHTGRIESSVSDALARGEATDVRHTLDPERTIWDPDRAEIHQQIVNDLYLAAADVPNDGQAIVAGGLGGAGKSTTLEDHAGIDRSSYLTINPDDIKESLAKRGFVPSVEGLAPMERSALVHEESSAIARSLAGRAYADRKNVIWDITMSSKPSTARRIQQLREAGYTNVEGIFVHIPVATSVERAQARHRHGLEDYRNGEGLGGRYVPPDVIRANADATWGSVNRRVFEELKPQFDSWKLYNNSVDGRGPVLVESSDGAERENDE